MEIPPSPGGHHPLHCRKSRGDKDRVCVSVDAVTCGKRVVDVVSSCEEEKWSTGGGGAERVMEVEKGAERCLVSLSNKESQ